VARVGLAWQHLAQWFQQRLPQWFPSRLWLLELGLPVGLGVGLGMVVESVVVGSRMVVVVAIMGLELGLG